MKIEVYQKNVYRETYSRYEALNFVYNHRNIFSDKITKKVILECPSVIKEISKKDKEKTVWYWAFLIDRYLVIKDAKKDKDVIDYVYSEYRKITEDK